MTERLLKGHLGIIRAPPGSIPIKNKSFLSKNEFIK